MFLDQYKDEYEDISSENETNMSSLYSAFNTITNKECYLKVISKEKLKTMDYDFLLERLRQEEEITKLCNSENTVNFYRKLETENHIIFELEYCNDNLNNYFMNNGELLYDKKFFKQIVRDLAKALKTIHNRGIMHRDIKPSNIFIKNLENKEKIIKLGDFGCSIYINNNISDSIGSILYSAPEMVKDLEYDEKIDLWSLGITLFELYFGDLPYGPNPNTNIMMKAIYDEKKFLFMQTFKKGEKPIIPTLDILFKRLLVINPNERMTLNEFYSYVFDENFMKEGAIFVNSNLEKRGLYEKLYEKILQQEDIKYEDQIGKEINDPIEKQKTNIKKINILVKGGHMPDIMNFSNASANDDNKFNNIIYYDSNTNYLKSINTDSDYFERETPGAFILCTNMESFKLVRTEILNQIKKDKRISFNLITTGSQCDNIMNFLSENSDFDNCIKKVCVFCMRKEKWSHLENKYEKVYTVCTQRSEVKKFIKNFASEEIKTYPLTKLITYNEYIHKYKDRHIKISQFYGDLTPGTYKQNITKMKSLINEEDKSKELKKNKKDVLEGFLTFDINNDLEVLDKLIIKEYTKETYYGDLNKWLMNSKLNSYEVIAYFTSRLMYSLNSYGKKMGTYYSYSQTELRRGMKLPYCCLLPYERAKNKVILLSAFTSTTEDPETARNFSGRGETKTLYKRKLLFSVILIIKNRFKQNWISNGVNIQKLSEYDEKEILYQPFSFYYVRDVQIDLHNYSADIYLETIGKHEVLEEKIKIGKEIIYNDKEKIMEVKK